MPYPYVFFLQQRIIAGWMPSLSKRTTSAFGVTSMNTVVNFYVDKSNEVCLLGGDVGSAKGKKQNGSLRASSGHYKHAHILRLNRRGRTEN